MKIDRNSLCACGSGKKYKKCCLTLENKPKQVSSKLSGLEEVCDNALALIEAGDFWSGEAEAERLYNLYPNDPTVNFLKGVCQIRRENYQKAISFFEVAVQINPNFCEAYYNLANLYRKEAKIPQSIVCLKKIIEIDGIDGNIGRLAKKDIGFFEKVFQKTSRQSVDEYLNLHTLFDEAFACLRKEEYRKAISLFQQVLNLNPNHVQSYGNMALAHSALGEQKIALQYLDKALLLDPNYEPAQQNRENILRLKEGESCPFIMNEVAYYKEKFESENKAQKPRELTFSSSEME